MRFLRTRALQFFVDGFVVCLAFALAYAIRFEGLPPRDYIKQLLLVLPYLVLLRLGLMAAFGVYRLVWRYVSLRDLPRILASVLAGSLMLVAARFGVVPLFSGIGLTLNPLFATVPYGVMAAEFLLTAGGIIAARSLWRLITEAAKRHTSAAQRVELKKRRALLIGAGAAGVMVAREVSTRPDMSFEVVGFLDDDPRKQGTVIHGYRVVEGPRGSRSSPRR